MHTNAMPAGLLLAAAFLATLLIGSRLQQEMRGDPAHPAFTPRVAECSAASARGKTRPHCENETAWA
jgi:hypothetical protein